MASIALAQRPDAISPGTLGRLTVNDFRSWTSLSVDAEFCPVVLTGANGSGKTNILEAISWLAPGRGLRGAHIREPCPYASGNPWTVSAQVMTPDGMVRIGTGFDDDRRVVRIDGVSARGPADMSAHLSIVWLTPSMDSLFREQAIHRRRFMDRLVATHDPLHTRRVGMYQRYLRERSRLLRERRDETSWIAILEENIAQTGIAIAAARRMFCDHLAPVLVDDLAPFPGVALHVTGRVEQWLDTMPALDAEQAFRTFLEQSRNSDRETGGAADGPHRSDLDALHLPTGTPANLCSTGQQKSLVVAIVLAAARLNADRPAPVLLLDDIAAHFDVRHRETLFAVLLQLNLQFWLTGTDPDVFTELEQHARFYRVADGRIALSS